MIVVAATSSIFFIFSGIAYLVNKKKRNLPCCITRFRVLNYMFKNNELNHKTQWYSFFYNFIFFIFLILIAVLGNTKELVSEEACSILAGINHYIFLVCILLSILKVFIMSEAIGNWKLWYRRLLWVLVGNENLNNWPLLHGLLWPLIVTGVFGLTQQGFFVRNDGL